MTIHQEPLYGIAYVDVDTALVDLAAASQQAATTTAAALARGGIAPPDATTQAQLAARITALETSINGWFGAWQQPTTAQLTANGWSNLGSGWGSFRYRKEGPKTVRVVGTLAGRSLTNDLLIYQLAAGFRPVSTVPGFAMAASQTFVQLSVDSSGNLRVQVAAALTAGYLNINFTFPID